MTTAKGKFITLEGGDGAGKSTVARRLKEYLHGEGVDVVLTREPGGSPGAEEIRSLIVEGDPGRWSPETEALLFKAARRDHLERTILPSIESGKLVLCDRFADSTRVYQGATRGDLREFVDKLHDIAIGVEPDLTVIIDIDPDVVSRRIKARLGGDEIAAQESRFERMSGDFPRKLRDGYLALAEQYPDRCVVIPGDAPEDVVFERVLSVVLAHI